METTFTEKKLLELPLEVKTLPKFENKNKTYRRKTPISPTKNKQYHETFKSKNKTFFCEACNQTFSYFSKSKDANTIKHQKN